MLLSQMGSHRSGQVLQQHIQKVLLVFSSKVAHHHLQDASHSAQQEVGVCIKVQTPKQVLPLHLLCRDIALRATTITATSSEYERLLNVDTTVCFHRHTSHPCPVPSWLTLVLPGGFSASARSMHSSRLLRMLIQ